MKLIIICSLVVSFALGIEYQRSNDNKQQPYPVPVICKMSAKAVTGLQKDITKINTIKLQGN